MPRRIEKTVSSAIMSNFIHIDRQLARYLFLIIFRGAETIWQRSSFPTREKISNLPSGLKTALTTGPVLPFRNCSSCGLAWLFSNKTLCAPT